MAVYDENHIVTTAFVWMNTVPSFKAFVHCAHCTYTFCVFTHGYTAMQTNSQHY